MASEGSQIDSELNIYFVISSKHKSSDDCSTDMWHAFNNCDEHELSPTWICEKDCDNLQPGKKDVFVMEEFKGAIFHKLRKSKCSRIVGPRCLLSCFMTGEPIPEGSSPIFTTPMRNLVISISGFSTKAKEEMQQKIEFMGGIFTKQLRSCSTHLITDSVLSVKYEKAVQSGLPIVTAKWLDAVWEASLVENVRATSSKFDKYKCPIFLNVCATSTNLAKHKKEDVNRQITMNGGTFMGALDGALVNIVIAPENTMLSEKLKFAMHNNIPCVKTQWIHHSIKHGYALPRTDYLITSTKGSSTPEKSIAHASLDFSTISTIGGDYNQNRFIEESMMTTISTVSDQSILQQKASHADILKRLSIQVAKQAGPFLDGCNIYLTGFSPDQRDKMNRILNFGSATRLDDISDAITHVIVGDESKASAEIKQMKSMGLSPYFLTINWLEESIKMKSSATEENFLYELKGSPIQRDKMEPPSPLSKKNLQLLQKPRRPPVPAFNIDKKMTSCENIEEPDLVQEYLKANVSGSQDSTLKVFLEQHTDREPVEKLSERNHSTISKAKSEVDEIQSIERSKNHAMNNSDTSIPDTQSHEANEIFRGLKFVVTGFEDQTNLDSLIESIELLGGSIVPNFFKGIPDFAVVPLLGASLKHTVNEIVTDLFIEDCVDQEQLLKVEQYHKPVSINTELKPLRNCVIAISSYTGKERTFISDVVCALGASYQDTMARRTIPMKNTLACTHLICPKPEGSKYNAAVKWNLPAVSSDWLMACVTQQMRVDEMPYLIGETTMPEKMNDSNVEPSSQDSAGKSRMCPPSVSNIRQIVTPKRYLANATASISGITVTPINKRLNLSGCKTPASPSAKSTPETPYGQFLKPDPSPDTRKRWAKWIERVPDMRIEEPPLKRRAPSTPLADLKRHLWERMKDPVIRDDVPDLAHENNVSNPIVNPESSNDHSESKSPVGSLTSVGTKLSYSDENSPTQTNQINLQLAQLDQVLQSTNLTPENRHSLSAESVKKAIYNSEPTDHIAKCVVKDSQPDIVGWEDPVHTALRRKSTIPEEEPANGTIHESICETAKEQKQTTPKFMLSGIKDRSIYEKIIQGLGGIVSTEPGYDSTATHLVCVKPGRNEKLLASIASGKWVLHYSYLIDSEKEGKFLNEENYEWGNPKSNDVITQSITETEEKVAAAAYRWRTTLLEDPGGAFKHVVALLIGNEEKCRQFETLICAGGGTVLETRPPYDSSPKSKKITHCFIQPKHRDQPIDWAMMASKGILCFLPQYLSEHLTSEKPLNPKECVLPEFRKYLSLLPK